MIAFQTTDSAPAPVAPPRPSRPPRRPIWQSGLAILLVAAFLYIVGYQSWLVGSQLRNEIWIENRGNHFNDDIGNAFRQGRMVLALAHNLDFQRHRDDPKNIATPDKLPIGLILEAMDQDYKNSVNGGSTGLDYPPGRLLVATLWARWAAAPEHFPRLASWTDSPTMFVSEPMLNLNTWAAAISAVAMFFLVFVWVFRSGWRDPKSTSPPVVERWWPPNGALAAIASATALILFIRFTVQQNQWPTDPFWFAMAVCFMTLVISVRRLPTAHRAWACGLISAEMLWFDPAVLAVSHVWPQWDVWPVPFFVVGALLASLDCWFLAGAVVAGGVMFKAQSLFGVPILVLWPLFAGRWSAALRVIGGFLAGGVALLWTFLVPGPDYTFLTVNPDLYRWIKSVAILAGLVGCAVLLTQLAIRLVVLYQRQRRALLFTDNPLDTDPPAVHARRASPLAIACLAFIILTISVALPVGVKYLKPAFHPAPDGVPFALLLIALVLLPWAVPWRHLPAWFLGTVAAAVLLAQSKYFFDYQHNGNWGWFDTGFVYGTEKFPNLQMGRGSFSNLPVVLANMRLISGNIHEYVGSVMVPFYGEWDIDVRGAFGMAYAATLVVCALAAARHSRRNDPRILVALAAPWILFPALMPQMSERYLLMSAAISAAVIGASSGLTLVHVILAVTGAMMTMNQIRTAGYSGRNILPISEIAGDSNPNSGWLIVACAAVMLAGSILPSRRPPNQPRAWLSLRTLAQRLRAVASRRTRAVIDFFAPLALRTGET